jgi:TonB family protein
MLYPMKTYFTAIAAVAVALLGIASPAQAQTAAFAGPRFPGGPDSLRALVFRSTHQGLPVAIGRMVVGFELKNGSQPEGFKLLTPPTSPNRELAAAAAEAVAYLRAQMPAWQPATDSRAAAPGQNPRVFLMLDFAAPKTGQPYAFADQPPVFKEAAALPPWPGGDYSPSNTGLEVYSQRLIKYPPAALRGGQEGVVYAYFEVAENGAIEHPAIVGTAGSALDAEVLRVVSNLPAATTPALLQGQPARLYYVMPYTFRMARR